MPKNEKWIKLAGTVLCELFTVCTIIMLLAGGEPDRLLPAFAARLLAALPMVLIDAVAGCESYNLRHFTAMGGAVTASGVLELTELCVELMKDHPRREIMESALLSRRYTDSAQCILRVMSDRVKGGAQ